MLVVPLVGDIDILSQLCVSYGWRMQLYQNNYTPVQGSTLADFVEADFSGYTGPQAIIGWSTPTIVSGHAKSLANMIQWTFGGGVTTNNIYGYYVISNTSGQLVFAERDPGAPKLMQPGSPPYQVIPAFTGISEFL